MITELKYQVDRLSEIPEEMHLQLSTVLGFLLDCYIFEGCEGLLIVSAMQNLHVMSMDTTAEDALRMSMAAAKIIADSGQVPNGTNVH